MINLAPIKPVFEQLDLKAFPLEAYDQLYAAEPYRFIYESLESKGQRGRYSFIGARPFLIFKSKGRKIEISHNGQTVQQTGDPLTVLRSLTEQIKAVYSGLPFAGGAIGYIGYDAIRLIEQIPDTKPDPLGLPDLYFIFPGEIISFDHLMHTVHIFMYGAEADWRRMEDIKSVLHDSRQDQPIAKNLPQFELPTDFASGFSQSDFEQAVLKSKEYIKAGDVFQVVLSRRIAFDLDPTLRRLPATESTSVDQSLRKVTSTENDSTLRRFDLQDTPKPERVQESGQVNLRKITPDDIYKALRQTNPSPYMYYLNFDGLAIAGSSPEILVSLNNGLVTTRPLAGTRPRGHSIEEDQVTAAELLADPKERAEHIMLVDLGRNDVGRVCEYGTVTVNELMAIERYSKVMHISSNVVGQLRHGLDAFDVFAATFPAGTVSGAPKIRAMGIIEELEPEKRGLYAGAIGYFGFSGNMDMCIAIRMILMQHGRGYIQSGAGIVADSDPEREYQETLNKARALLQAVELAKQPAVKNEEF